MKIEKSYSAEVSPIVDGPIGSYQYIGIDPKDIYPDCEARIDDGKITLILPISGPDVKFDLPIDVKNRLGPVVMEMLYAETCRKVIGQLIATAVRY